MSLANSLFLTPVIEDTKSFCVAQPTQMLFWTEPATDALGF